MYHVILRFCGFDEITYCGSREPPPVSCSVITIFGILIQYLGFVLFVIAVHGSTGCLLAAPVPAASHRETGLVILRVILPLHFPEPDYLHVT